MREDFFANFLNANLALLLSDTSENNEITFSTNENGAEYVEYAAELKMNENFYFNLYEKLKILCNQENNNVKVMQLKQFQHILVDFICCPLPLPRAFFNTLQKTQIKLIVNPNTTKKTNTITNIRNDQTLVVKIDGIISQQFKTKAPFRTIKKVQISLTTELDTKSLNDAKFNALKYSDVKTSLEEPKNDYFNSNILLSFPYLGNYTITVDLYIMDDANTIWRYLSEKHQILVKVEEDPNRQKMFAAAMAAAAVQQQQQHQPGTSAHQELQQKMDF